MIPAMEMKDDLSGYQFNSWLRYDLPNVTDPVKMDEALDEIAVDSNLNKSFSFTAVTDADGR